MPTLHLTLKKEWFNMILSGEKKEEYREIKPYWIRRLMDDNYPYEEPGGCDVTIHNMIFDKAAGHSWPDIMNSYYQEFKKFDTIRFTNGYGKNAPSFDIECKRIGIGNGVEKWGGTQNVFIIYLGNIIK